MTASPLLLHQADDVALLVDGRVAERGTHEGLLHSSPAYRRRGRPVDGGEGAEAR